MNRKTTFIWAMVFFAFIFTQLSFAQLTGTKTIPGDYATITAAITALNTSGVGSGGVTFNVTAGYSEFISARLNITATGTSGNQIIFQKSGSGTNPIVKTGFAGTSTPGSATPDGIWSLQGSDYITIDGIDLLDTNTTNPGTMEYGYGLFKNSVTDGAQYNTIKNCTVTLNRINNASGTAPMVDGSVCILVINSIPTAATTALIPTAATGSNSYNKFYTNTLQNSNYGIVIYGYADVTPFTNGDNSNDIGGSSVSTGNQILNFGGGAATNPAAGIRTQYQWSLNVSYNTINNNNGSGVNHATTLRGIYTQSGVSANITISYNTLTLKSAVTTSQVSIIENGTGATAASNTVNINNNTITNCTNDLTTSGVWYGIYNNGATAANLNINSNTFTNNTSKATSGATYMIYNNAAVTTSINMNSNNLSCTYNNTAAYTGAVYSVYNGSGTTTTSLNMNSNNFSNYNFGSNLSTGSIYFCYNSNGNLNTTMNSNTWTNLTLYNSGAHYLLYNSGSTQSALNVNNNNIVTAYTRTGTAGSMYLYYSGASSLGTSTQTISGNNFSHITANVNGTGTFYGIYSSDGASSPYPKKSIFNNTVSNVIYKTSGTVYGIYMSYLGDGSTTSGSSFYNNTVSNIVDSATTYCIYPGTITSPTYAPSVYGNVVNNVTSYGISSIVYAYYLGASTPGLNFYKNKAYNISEVGATGLAYGIYTASAYPYYIYNNYIGDLKAPNSSPASAPYLAVAGVYLSSGSTVNVMYNTIYLNTTSAGTNFTTAAVYGTTTPSTINLINNIFVNLSTPKGAGFTVAHQRSSSTWTNYTAGTSNNNLFYAGTPSATNLICYDGTNSYQTLASYKSVITPRDGASVTENPNFLSTTGSDATYLHINPATATQIESGGQVISTPSITDDYDGQARYPNSGYPNNTSYPAYAPDLGADEFAGIWMDISGPIISYTPFLNTPSTSARTLVATITDPSGVPTSGAGLPVLYWKINSGSFTAATATSLGSNQYQFTFGSGVAIGDVVSYYICAQDMNSTPNVSCSPLTGATGFSYNPPAVSTPPTAPNSYTISNTPLSGDYTVGLTLFNKITGKNITFAKEVKKVIKEVMEEQPLEKVAHTKGSELKEANDATASLVPKSNKVKKEVEEIIWVPMENGKKYTGNLYVKKNESPEYSYPSGINGIYATLTAATTDLNLRGVSGATRFLLNDTAYSTETLPLTINVSNINMPTASNTVTIKPSSGVTSRIYGASINSQVIKIKSNYTIIDGSNTNGGTTRNLTIQNTSTTTPQVILIGSTGTTPITNVTFSNCNIINGVNTSTAFTISDGTTSGAAGYFSNITVQNNSFQLAYMGIYAIASVASGNGNGLLINGNNFNTTANPVRLCKIYIQGVDGATVSNNIIGADSNSTDASNITGIWLATSTINSTISGNTISNIVSSTGAPRAIAVSSGVANANITITGNTISGIRTSYSGTPYGIYVFATTSGVNITKNKVSSIASTNTGGYGARGINIATTLSPANINIINNFVWNVYASGDASSSYWGIGIAVDAAVSNINVYANSVNLYGSYAGYTSATIHTAIYIASGASLLNIRDNIFKNSFNNTNSITDVSYSIYSGVANTAYTDINYNDYYVSDSVGVLGYLGSAQSTLALWRTATGKDANSVNGDPKFTAESDLHISTNQISPVGNAGVFISTVTDDIDGNTRSTTTPDIGACEYAPLTAILLSPANNSVGNQTSVNLIWTKPTGWSKFNLMVATDAAFTNLIVNDTTLTDSVYTLSGLNSLTSYYWKVSTKFTNWSYFSSAYTFKTMGSPNTVTLYSPSNNATNQPVSLTFAWYKTTDQTLMKVKGNGTKGTDGPKSISNYWFELATDAGFTNVINRDSTLTDSTKSVTGLSNSTDYYWRVKAKNQLGWGTFSTGWKFTTIVPLPGVPVLVSPANNSTGNPLSLNLVWTKPANSINYNVMLATDTGFTNIIVNDSTLTDSVRAVTGLAYNTAYYWKVRAKSLSGWSSFSGWSKFTTMTDPTALTQANYTAVIVPKIMTCGGTTRMPVVVRGTLINLTPNRLYRYYSNGAAFSDLGTTNSGAGNPMFMNPDSSVYKYTSSVGLTTTNGYDVFRANSSGTYTGWFCIVNTANARFAAGKYIIPSIVLGDSVGTLISRIAMNDSIKVVNFSSNAQDTCATGIYGISVGFPKNVVSLYDNTTGTGKPISQTYIESEGVTVASIAPFYTTYAEGLNGRWGTVIPNVNANGVKRVEQRNLSTGNLMTYNTSATGIWTSGANTVNPAGGLTPVGLLLNDAPLLDYPALVYPANNATNVPTTVTLNWNTVTYGSTYRVQLATDTNFTAIIKDSTLVPDSLLVTGLLSGQTYYWRVAAGTTTGMAGFGTRYKFTTASSVLSLNLRAYLEGFYDGTSQVMDTVKVYLAGTASPHSFVDSAKMVLSTNGSATFTFNNAAAGSYYIVVTHRNHLETWSANTVAFTGGTPTSYDFTTASTQAYGGNMKQVGSVWVFIVGDANQDGSIDASDVTDLLIPQYGNVGYLSCDFNGDGSVDAADIPFMIANYGLVKVVPTLDGVQPVMGNKNKTDKKQELDVLMKKIGTKNSGKNNKNNN